MAVDVLCHPRAARARDLREAGLDVACLDVRHRLDVRAIRFLRDRLRARGYRIVYAPDNAALSVSLFAARHEPARVVGYRGTVGHLSRWDPASHWTYLNPRLDRIVCLSHAVQGYLRDKMGLPDSKLTVIYKGQDPTWRRRTAALAPLAEFGIPPDSFTIGFAGRIRPVKGVAYLLRALAELTPSHPNLHLLLAGELCDRTVARLAGRDAVAKHVHFTGFRDDAACLMGRCRLFAMPSVAREGLCRAVLEAMAQSVPAIVSNVGGLPETVVDGESGLIVPPRDPRALADAIRFFVQHPERRAAFGEQARRRVETVFDIRETIRRMADLFNDLS